MFARPIRPTCCAGIQRHWVASTTKVWVKPGHVAWGQCTMWCCCWCSSIYVWCTDYNNKLRAWIMLLGLRCLIFLTTYTVLICCVRRFCHANGVIECFATFSISWCPCIYLIMAPDTMAALVLWFTRALQLCCSEGKAWRPAPARREQGDCFQNKLPCQFWFATSIYGLLVSQRYLCFWSSSTCIGVAP